MSVANEAGKRRGGYNTESVGVVAEWYWKKGLAALIAG